MGLRAEPISYEFDECLSMSQGVSESDDIGKIIIQNIPSAVAVHQAHSSNDRTGIDWWVETSTGKMLCVDCKVREEDWAAKSPKHDDLALESWSVVEKSVIGWTRDESKKTDYVLWFWKDTRRWCLIPFPMLCKVYADNWERWRNLYKTDRQKTYRKNGNSYHSECTFVPRKVVWASIYRAFA